jgi:hypothetical protein
MQIANQQVQVPVVDARAPGAFFPVRQTESMRFVRPRPAALCAATGFLQPLLPEGLMTDGNCQFIRNR